jgi:uncharacterized membrane protein
MANVAAVPEARTMVDIGAGVVLIALLSVVLTLAIPVAIVWLIVVLVRRSSDATSRPRYDPAAEQLRYRYARGEISQAAFEQGMHLLGYERAP